MTNSIRVSNRILSLLGQNLYSAAPVFPITIRELLQNSYDAQRACNESMPIQFKIIRNSDESITLTCIDNGVGMSDEIIKSKFLVIGESGKDEGVGGFGVAKAAIILACDSWELTTLDNYLRGTADTVKIPMRSGCQIDLHYRDHENKRIFPGRYSCIEALSYLATSAAASDVEFINKNTGSNNIIRFSGLFLSKDTLLEEFDNNRNHIKIHCVPRITFKSQWSYKSYDSTDDECIQDQVIYRLNGLTQFISYGSCSGTGINLVVDITTDARPDDADYPFSLSREELVSSVRESLSDKISNYFSNYLSTAVKLKETSGKKKVHKQYYAGNLHDGYQKAKQVRENNDYAVSEQLSTQVADVVVGRLTNVGVVAAENDNVFHGDGNVDVEEVSQFSNISSPVELLATSPFGVKTMIRRAGKTIVKVNSKKHVKLLGAWTELIALIMTLSPYYRHSFGIGFILDKDYQALRETDNGTVYYLVNPAGLKTSDAMAAVMKMLLSACHEVTHTHYRNHGEGFTVAESDLVNRFLDTYGMKVLYEIARQLRLG